MDLLGHIEDAKKRDGNTSCNLIEMFDATAAQYCNLAVDKVPELARDLEHKAAQMHDHAKKGDHEFVLNTLSSLANAMHQSLAPSKPM